MATLINAASLFLRRSWVKHPAVCVTAAVGRDKRSALRSLNDFLISKQSSVEFILPRFPALTLLLSCASLTCAPAAAKEASAQSHPRGPVI